MPKIVSLERAPIVIVLTVTPAQAEAVRQAFCFASTRSDLAQQHGYRAVSDHTATLADIANELTGLLGDR